MATAAADEGVRYRDKVTIVTGGANGIGRACVELFGKIHEGCNISSKIEVKETPITKVITCMEIYL